MNREQLFDLTERVKLVAGVELPVIVGSQSLYGVTPHVPEIVKRSVECDFLLLAAGPPAFRAVIEQIGFASSFQETHGYYADAVGLATSCCPRGGRSGSCVWPTSPGTCAPTALRYTTHASVS